jgi:hypothetical protein
MTERVSVIASPGAPDAQDATRVSNGLVTTATPRLAVMTRPAMEMTSVTAVTEMTEMTEVTEVTEVTGVTGVTEVTVVTGVTAVTEVTGNDK